MITTVQIASFACMVGYSDPRSLQYSNTLHRFFYPDTGKALLHRTQCDGRLTYQRINRPWLLPCNVSFLLAGPLVFKHLVAVSRVDERKLH
jgi:hypothetical protein